MRESGKGRGTRMRSEPVPRLLRQHFVRTGGWSVLIKVRADFRLIFPQIGSAVTSDLLFTRQRRRFSGPPLHREAGRLHAGDWAGFEGGRAVATQRSISQGPRQTRRVMNGQSMSCRRPRGGYNGAHLMRLWGDPDAMNHLAPDV